MYDVSDTGVVRSWRRNRWGRAAKPRILRPGTGKNGYPLVGLSNDRYPLGISRYIHRLVAHAFLGPCPAGHEVNHKNSDRSDARLKNLEYVTQFGNWQHAFEAGRTTVPSALKGEANNKAKLTEEAVKQIRASTATGVSLAERFKVSDAVISKVRRGETWRHVASFTHRRHPSVS